MNNQAKNGKFHTILILAVIAIIGVNFYFMSIKTNEKKFYFPGIKNNFTKPSEPIEKENIIKVSTECKIDSDCSWQVTNCCSESAGGSWDCISKGSQIECNQLVLCPQVLSPKPTISCTCSEGRCKSG